MMIVLTRLWEQTLAAQSVIEIFSNEVMYGFGLNYDLTSYTVSRV